MPSLVIPMRRQREELVDGDEVYSRDSTPGSDDSHSSSKRARLNGESQSQLLPDGYLPQASGTLPRGRLHAEPSVMEYQPGSIVRVKLANFVTYTDVEFFPGPSLNMVIGPNGTGKSTLVCAICLGLGWGAQHLGRAKDVSEFVKHGSQESTIEIELKADGKKHRRNPVIRCQIKREGNKTNFMVNGKPSNKKLVKELAQSFSIQIDNLCQFLPQDKVVEFAAMTPVELLRSTQRAVASQEMIEWHEQLKKIRKDQRESQVANQQDLETLASLEARHKLQEADVAKFREREKVLEKVGMLEATRPFAKYRDARLRHRETKEKMAEAAKELKKLEADVEPSLQAVNEKQRYRDQIKRVVEERRKIVDDADQGAEAYLVKVNALQDKIKDCGVEKSSEKKGIEGNRTEEKRLKDVVRRLNLQMEEPTVEFDAAAYNERIREKDRAGREIKSKVPELRNKMKELNETGAERNRRILQAQKDIEDLESQAGQQQTKLAALSLDSAKAWRWIQENQGNFDKPIMGPPVITCSVKDPRYVDLVENCFNKNDFVFFTAQTRSDFNKLHRQLYNILKLNHINIRTMTDGLENFRPPINEQEMKQFGFDGWALDYISGPEPVLASLCAEGAKLHSTAFALQDTTQAQFDMLQNSVITSWNTKKSVYRIARRREYGPGATSTMVRDLRQATVWTDKPVDMAATRDLQRNIDQWSEDINQLKAEIGQINVRIQQLGQQCRELENEELLIKEERDRKRKAVNEQLSLPIRLDVQQKNLDKVQRALAGVKERLNAIEEREDVVTLEKGQAALDYTKAVESLRKAHNDLHEAELMLIEAVSDVETLTERNGAVKQHLESKRREVNEINEALKDSKDIAKKLMDECIQVQAGADETLRAFWASASEGQTFEELEAEIESEKARLELMHEGDGRVIKDYEARAKKIEGLREKLQGVQETLANYDAKIKEIRDDWEPKLDRLIARISDSFGFNMKQISCAGEVGVYKDEEDFDQWAIQIKVKFREHEPLSLLDSHRQSGGERAVSTIFYLMSLQSLTRSPFRVVDEINQGMDPRNERLVHARMVSIATGNDEHQFQDQERLNGEDEAEGTKAGGSQYFLITPKLLHGLRYERGMRVLCIASGEYMPKDQTTVDFKRCVEIRSKVVAAA